MHRCRRLMQHCLQHLKAHAAFCTTNFPRLNCHADMPPTPPRTYHPRHQSIINFIIRMTSGIRRNDQGNRMHRTIDTGELNNTSTTNNCGDRLRAQCKYGCKPWWNRCRGGSRFGPFLKRHAYSHNDIQSVHGSGAIGLKTVQSQTSRFSGAWTANFEPLSTRIRYAPWRTRMQ